MAIRPTDFSSASFSASSLSMPDFKPPSSSPAGASFGPQAEFKIDDRPDAPRFSSSLPPSFSPTSFADAKFSGTTVAPELKFDSPASSAPGLPSFFAPKFPPASLSLSPSPSPAPLSGSGESTLSAQLAARTSRDLAAQTNLVAWEPPGFVKDGLNFLNKKVVQPGAQFIDRNVVQPVERNTRPAREFLDKNVVEPAKGVYRQVVPQPARSFIRQTIINHVESGAGNVQRSYDNYVRPQQFVPSVQPKPTPSAKLTVGGSASVQIQRPAGEPVVVQAGGRTLTFKAGTSNEAIARSGIVREALGLPKFVPSVQPRPVFSAKLTIGGSGSVQIQRPANQPVVVRAGDQTLTFKAGTTNEAIAKSGIVREALGLPKFQPAPTSTAPVIQQQPNLLQQFQRNPVVNAIGQYASGLGSELIGAPQRALEGVQRFGERVPQAVGATVANFGDVGQALLGQKSWSEAGASMNARNAGFEKLVTNDALQEQRRMQSGSPAEQAGRKTGQALLDSLGQAATAVLGRGAGMKTAPGSRPIGNSDLVGGGRVFTQGSTGVRGVQVLKPQTPDPVARRIEQVPVPSASSSLVKPTQPTPKPGATSTSIMRDLDDLKAILEQPAIRNVTASNAMRSGAVAMMRDTPPPKGAYSYTGSSLSNPRNDIRPDPVPLPTSNVPKALPGARSYPVDVTNPKTGQVTQRMVDEYTTVGGRTTASSSISKLYAEELKRLNAPTYGQADVGQLANTIATDGRTFFRVRPVDESNILISPQDARAGINAPANLLNQSGFAGVKIGVDDFFKLDGSTGLTPRPGANALVGVIGPNKDVTSQVPGAGRQAVEAAQTFSFRTGADQLTGHTNAAPTFYEGLGFRAIPKDQPTMLMNSPNPSTVRFEPGPSDIQYVHTQPGPFDGSRSQLFGFPGGSPDTPGALGTPTFRLAPQQLTLPGSDPNYTATPTSGGPQLIRVGDETRIVQDQNRAPFFEPVQGFKQQTRLGEPAQPIKAFRQIDTPPKPTDLTATWREMPNNQLQYRAGQALDATGKVADGIRNGTNRAVKDTMGAVNDTFGIIPDTFQRTATPQQTKLVDALSRASTGASNAIAGTQKLVFNPLTGQAATTAAAIMGANFGGNLLEGNYKAYVGTPNSQVPEIARMMNLPKTGTFTGVTLDPKNPGSNFIGLGINLPTRENPFSARESNLDRFQFQSGGTANPAYMRTNLFRVGEATFGGNVGNENMGFRFLTNVTVGGGAYNPLYGTTGDVKFGGGNQGRLPALGSAASLAPVQYGVSFGPVIGPAWFVQRAAGGTDGFLTTGRTTAGGNASFGDYRIPAAGTTPAILSNPAWPNSDASKRVESLFIDPASKPFVFPVPPGLEPGSK